MSDEFDQFPADDPEGDEDQGVDGESETPASESDETSGISAAEQKRISDLMSKWQKAEERAKKAEERLAAQGQAAGPTDASQMAQYLQWIQEQTRDQVFRSDPRFARYGLESSLIEGTTPEQMRQSAQKLVRILDSVEADAQSSVLKRHGLSPDVKGGEAERLPDFSTMSDEQFDAYLAKTR